MAWNDNKVNGASVAGEHLGRNLDFFVLSSTTNILPLSASGTATSQKALDKLVEVISLNGQPVILGTPYLSGSDYIVKFATEHTGAWTAASLKAAVIADAPVDFSLQVANATTMSVTITNEV